MRPQRACLDCHTLTRNPHGRCRPCELDRQRTRNQLRKDKYPGSWWSLSRQARQAEPWCHRPGCPNPNTNDLTLDHETGTVECRSCNASHRRNPA